MIHLDLAVRLGGVLHASGVPYHIGGSVAGGVYGDPRATNDLDVAVQMEALEVAPLARALGDDFMVDIEMLSEAAAHCASANIFFLPVLVKVDFFFSPDSGFDAQEMARRRWLALDESGRGFYVKSLEDTVLRKLRWYEDGHRNSSRQWSDVLAILKRQSAQVDRGYLETWARRLGINGLLDDAFAAVG